MKHQDPPLGPDVSILCSISKEGLRGTSGGGRDGEPRIIETTSTGGDLYCHFHIAQPHRSTEVGPSIGVHPDRSASKYNKCVAVHGTQRKDVTP